MKIMPLLLPKARTADIIEQEAGGDLLIYDLNNNKAYHLNETSKAVFSACNGATTFNDLKRRHKFTEDLIYFALDELEANNLIENYRGNHFGSLSRREIVKRVGLTCVAALPIVAGITAPSAAIAASGRLRANNQACTTDAQCASGNCTADSNFVLTCCAQTANSNFPLRPGGSFQSGSQNTCNAQAARFCCSGTGMFDSANSGTCTCT
jgi:hypothetical protein